MKIRTQYNFYLDFFLPPLDMPLALKIENPLFEAYIEGWDRTNHLFFDEVGQTLAGAELTVQYPESPGAQQTLRVRELCLDRLCVTIDWEADAIPDDNAKSESLDRAVRCANLVLDHLRAITQTPSVRRIQRHWRIGDSSFEITIPHTESWVNLDDNTPLPIQD